MRNDLTLEYDGIRSYIARAAQPVKQPAAAPAPMHAEQPAKDWSRLNRIYSERLSRQIR